MWLVIGYGSALHRDDGFGWTVTERLRALVDADACTVVAAHQLTPELAQPISLAEGVIFVDASADLPSGQIHCRKLAGTAATRSTTRPVFTHHCAPEALLEGARALYGHAPPGWLYAVGGADFALGETLSPAVEAVIPRVVARILVQVRGGDEAR